MGNREASMPEPTRTLLKPDSWPAAHRAALAVVIDMDPATSPWNSPSAAASEAAADRLMAMLADLDIVPTVVIDPDAADAVRVPGGSDTDPAVHVRESNVDISSATTACQERLGASPNGLVLLSDVPDNTIGAQDLWIIDGSGAPHPERMSTGRVVIPYSRWWHDATWLSPDNPSPPSAFLEHLTMSMASIRARGEMMTLYLTAQIAGHPGHVEVIQRFLDETIAAGDVWITSGSGIAAMAAEH